MSPPLGKHFLPTYAHTSPITRKNIASHLGDGTGRPVRGGGKNARAARHALLFVFGGKPIATIGPQDVRAWQTSMVRAGTSGSTSCATTMMHPDTVTVCP